MTTLAFYAALWLALALVGGLVALVFWLSGEDLVIQDPRCTDEDLARLAGAPIETGPTWRRWP